MKLNPTSRLPVLRRPHDETIEETVARVYDEIQARDAARPAPRNFTGPTVEATMGNVYDFFHPDEADRSQGADSAASALAPGAAPVSPARAPDFRYPTFDEVMADMQRPGWPFGPRGLTRVVQNAVPDAARTGRDLSTQFAARSIGEVGQLPPAWQVPITPGTVQEPRPGAYGTFHNEVLGQIVGGTRDTAQDLIDLGARAVGVEPWQLPDTPAPTTTLGKIVCGAAEIGAGLVAGFGMTRITRVPRMVEAGLGALGVGERAAAAGAALAEGELAAAIADQTVADPFDRRMSDLIQAYPALQNPLTAYLQSDPSDGEAEARFKRAVEGLGLGAAVGGAALGIAMGMRAPRNVASPNNWLVQRSVSSRAQQALTRMSNAV